VADIRSSAAAPGMRFFARAGPASIGSCPPSWRCGSLWSSSPLAVLFVFSFFETKNFQTVFHPSLSTWEGLLESGPARGDDPHAPHRG